MIRKVLAVLRLVFRQAFLSVPEAFWRRGELCGGNLLVLEAVERLREVLWEAEDILAAREWSVRKARSA